MMMQKKKMSWFDDTDHTIAVILKSACYVAFRWGCLAWCALYFGAASAATPGKVCHLPGHEMPLRCLTVEVPRDYAQAAKGVIKLHVAVAVAFRENAKPDPLFVLAGGPGQAGSGLAALLENGFHKVRATRDIVLIDQRGTGKSGKLACAEMDKIEIDDPDLAEQEVVRCLRSLKVDFAEYSTEAAARDLDRVRQALQLEKINIWGGSYGTRLGQAYARLFPSHLRSMILDGVVSPTQNVALFSDDAGRAMGILRSQCQQDAQCNAAFPQFAAQLDALVARAARGNEMIRFVHPATGRPMQLPLRRELFAEQVRGLLYRPQSAVRLPWLLMQASQDNWQPFVAMAMAGGGGEDGLALGLTLAVLCAEDVAHLTPAEIAAEQGFSFLGDSWTKKLLRLCEVIHVPARPRPAMTSIQTPTLLLSGQRDPVTPPARAELALRYLPNGQHRVAQQVGHIVTPYGCGPRLLREFLDAPDKKLPAKCLSEITSSPFVMSAAGAQP